MKTLLYGTVGSLWGLHTLGEIKLLLLGNKCKFLNNSLTFTDTIRVSDLFSWVTRVRVDKRSTEDTGPPPDTSCIFQNFRESWISLAFGEDHTKLANEANPGSE